MSIDVSATIESAAEVKVALCPIGKISPTVFNKYAEVINSFNTIPLSHLTHDVKSSPFKNNNWQKGRFRFRFVDHSHTGSQHEDFQPYRKVHAVIAVMHCAKERDIAATYTKYTMIREQYKHIVAGRCFAVEPLDNQQDVWLEDLVMIPNQDLSKLQFYVGTLINDLADCIITAFEKKIQSKTLVTPSNNNNNNNGSPRASSMGLSAFTAFGKDDNISPSQYSTPRLGSTTPTSDAGSNSSSGSSISLVAPDSPMSSSSKSKSAYKKMKIMGDYCLLVGDLADAKIKYQSAIDLLKSTSDSLWLAGALEGMACTLLLSNQPLSASENEWVIEKVIESYNEIITRYRKLKYPVDLQVEALLKLAHFYEECGPVARRTQTLECIVSAVQYSESLTTQDKILVNGEAARVCKRLGAMRKYSFFLRTTSLLHHELCNDEVALRLTDRYLAHYHLPLSYKDSKWVITNVKHTGWPSIQIKILKDIINFASSMNDNLTVAQMVLYLLAIHHENLTENEQLVMFSKLSKIASKVHTPEQSLTLVPFPFLKSIKPQRLPEHLRPLKTAEELSAEQPKKQSIFIFSPFAKKDTVKEKIIWVEDEFAHVDIEVYNPFKVNLQVESVNISAEGVEYVSHGSGGMVMSGERKLMRVSVKPIKTGVLQIKHLCLRLSRCPFTNPIMIPYEAEEVVVVGKLAQLSARLHVDKLNLYDGQRGEVAVTFENVGSLPISQFDLQLVNTTANTISWQDASIVEKQLPMKPGSSFTMYLNICANREENPARNVSSFISVTYGHTEDARRTVKLPLEICVSTGAFVKDCLLVDHSRYVMATVTNGTAAPFLLIPPAETEGIDGREAAPLLLDQSATKTLLIPAKHLNKDNFQHEEDFTAQVIKSLQWQSSINTYGNVRADINNNTPTSPVNPEKKHMKHKHEYPAVNLQIFPSTTTTTTTSTEAASLQSVVPVGTMISLRAELRHTFVNSPAASAVAKAKEDALTVRIKVFQDAENGRTVEALPSMLMHSGSLQAVLSAKHEKHEISLCFIEPGFYKVYAECRDSGGAYPSTCLTITARP